MSQKSRTESHSQNQKTAQTKSENITESDNKGQKTTNKLRQHERENQNMGVTKAAVLSPVGFGHKPRGEGRFWPQTER